MEDELLKYINSLRDLEKDLKIDDRIVKLKDLSKKYPVDANLKMMELSNQVSKKISEFSKDLVKSEKFKNLTRKQRSDIIREYLSTGLERGYVLNSKIGFDVYNSVLKESGLLFTPVLDSIDVARQKAIIANIIKLEINDDTDPIGFVENAFNGFIPDGTRNVMENTAKKIEMSGMKVVGRRVIQSSNPCDFCLEMAEQRFEVGHSLTHTKFHDHCHCGLVFEVER